jgi:hypothetical protein
MEQQMYAPRSISQNVLAPNTAVTALRKRHLICDRQTVDDQLRIREVSRRNRTLLVAGDDGGFVLKQSLLDEQSVDREAAMLSRLASVEHLRDALPHVSAYDARKHVLILQLEPDAMPLRERVLSTGRAEPSHAALLGDVLSRIHSIKKDNTWLGVGSAPPAILMIHRPTLRTWQESSLADRELLRTIQRTIGFGPMLERLHGEWEPSALIHNDMRLSNCLLRTPGRRASPTMMLVDWEVAQWGDPCWDVGSAIAEYLAGWLLSIPVAGDGPPDRFVHLAGFPLEQAQPAIHALWEAWSAGMTLSAAEHTTRLSLSTRYAAARLVHRAWEHTRTADTIVPGIAVLLQVAFNMLSRPDEAASRLLGLNADARGRQ